MATWSCLRHYCLCHLFFPAFVVALETLCPYLQPKILLLTIFYRLLFFGKRK
jgi:hypothetical protein